MTSLGGSGAAPSGPPSFFVFPLFHLTKQRNPGRIGNTFFAKISGVDTGFGTVADFPFLFSQAFSMTQSPESRNQNKIWIAFVLVALGVTLLGAGFVGWWLLKPVDPSTGDPRISYSGPFLNIHPSVQYVGDKACDICHQDIAHSFHNHPMALDLFEVSQATRIEDDSVKAHNPFEHGLFAYRVDKKDGKVFHEEKAIGALDDPDLTSRWEISFANGSGAKARSYLVNRDGYLFQSPITWYPESKRWDISPGYENRHFHFDRPITPDCIFCHSNFADHIEGTVNRYRSPIFKGLSIGCERCHGPGQLHVQKQESGKKNSGPDFTIVNPARLEPELQEAICQQCHIQGEKRVLARGSRVFDFRPGMPLDLFMMDFMNKNDLNGDRRFVSSVEQMHVSVCFLKTSGSGKLGCTSCHDPHSVPEKDEKVEYFQAKCLICHETRPCTQPKELRLKEVPNDSCIDCHMPKRGSEINHTAITDHRIPRKIDKARNNGKSPPRDTALPGELIPFHENRRNANDREARRNLGLAIMGMLDRGIPDHRARIYADSALPLLEKALKDDPMDWPVVEGLADAYVLLGYLESALTHYQRILEAKPGAETVQVGAAIVYLEMKQPQKALPHLEEVLRINPWNPRYYQYLATAQLRLAQLPESEKTCRAGLKIDPTQTALWSILIDALLAQKKEPEAKETLTKLLALTPKERIGSLKAWYETEKIRFLSR